MKLNQTLYNRIFQFGIILLITSVRVLAQQVEVITENVTKETGYEGKSYLVVKSLTLKNFTVSAATNGAWFAKVHPNAVTPTTPSADQNFVQSESILVNGITTEAQIRSLTVADKSASFSYADGLGRGIQNVSVATSPNLNDQVQTAYFDAQGRPSRQYLPYSETSGTSGSFRSTGLANQVSFYNSPPSKVESDTRSYSESTFENSPLNRVFEAKAVGSAWSNESVTGSLTFNDAGTIRLWSVVSGLPFSNSYYPANSLAIAQSEDEEDNTVRTYSDFLGRTILKEVQVMTLDNSWNWAQTYYLYDYYGKPLFVITPEAADNASPNQDFVDRWCFQYEYDEFQRPIGAKTPGAGWVYTIYDKWDRPVLTQDANQRAKATPEWSFVKYDDLNRPIVTGVFANDSTRAQLTSRLALVGNRFEERNSTSVGYTLSKTYPKTISETHLLSIVYYDDYSYLGNVEWDVQNNSFSFVSESGYTGSVFSNVKDLTTGGKIKILGSNPTVWLNSVTYYDNRYRPLQVISENQFGKTDRLTTEFDFSGKVLKTKQVHQNATQSYTLQERYSYDVSGRLLNTWHQINSQPEVLISSLQYNELGQVIDKHLHSADNGATWLQSVDYRYNIRGWMTNMNYTTPDSGDPVDYFQMELAYNESQSGNDDQYNGLISGIKWRHDLSGKERVYNFGYNKSSLNTSAYKVDNTANAQTGIYNENITQYDKNGNIKALNRNGGSLTSSTIDNLTYNYDYNGTGGNQLAKVTDAATTSGFVDGNIATNDYVYDLNGNLTEDKNKGITITYNFLNLPVTITFSDNSSITYEYDASGSRLNQKFYTSPGNEDVSKRINYEGNFVYLGGVPQLIFHSQGRILPSSGANLISNTSTREASSLEGYTSNGSVTLTSETVNNQSYVKAVCNQSTSTPGVWPIGGTITVKPGEGYSYRILGYQSVGSNAYLYVWGNNGDIIWTGTALSVGAGNEGLAESTFTVPSGVTQIKLGVLWSGGGTGNTFYINRVMLYKTDWEYQYLMRDHLGSPRVVLQTQPHTVMHTATMEAGSYADENTRFLNLVSSKEVPFALANATPGGANAYVLNSSAHVGPGKSFKVFPGDIVNASVMAYYTSGGTYSKTALNVMAGIVMNALSGGVAGNIDGVTTASYSNSGGSNPDFLLSPNQGSSRPSAFINYILFDETYTPIEAKSAPVGATAGVLHNVPLPTINVTQTGYLYIYLSYDNEAGGQDVYFDEFKITYQESPVIQVNSYYPFGMTAFSWVREGENENQYLYQGKEYETLTGLHDFHARQFDAALGRWFVGDPAGQFASPYLGMGNNPVIGVDPDGRFWHIVIGAAIGGVVNLAVKAYQGKIHSWGDGFAAFGIGAVAGAVGAATGGAAFAAAGGAAGGVGGFAAGFVGGAVGAAYAMPIQSMGNTIYFGDPMMTAGEYAAGIALGGLLGGTVNGAIAASNGLRFGNGTPKLTLGPIEQPVITQRPDFKSLKLTNDPEIQTVPNQTAQNASQVGDDVATELPQNVKLTTGDFRNNPVTNADYKIGSSAAWKSLDANDLNHSFTRIVDNYSGTGSRFVIAGGDGVTRSLYQVQGTLNGVSGRFEWLLEGSKIVHRMFIPNGTINGIPIKP